MVLTLLDKQQQFSRTAGLFLAWMAEQNYHWTMGDMWRSTDELKCPHCGNTTTYQALLQFNGRSQVLRSKHNDRLAMDIILFTDTNILAPPENYRPIGLKWEALGGKWGGRFGVSKQHHDSLIGWDPGHLEL